MSVCDSVDLPEPFGPITACTSPFEMPSDTPFRIWRPSTLARRSLISKSANLLFLLLHHVSAVIVRFSHPGRSSHVGSEKPLIHLLLVDARQPGAGGDVLDGTVAVADRQPAVPKLDHLGHVPVLGGEPGPLANSRCQVYARQSGRIFGLDLLRAPLEELLQLLDGHE